MGYINMAIKNYVSLGFCPRAMTLAKKAVVLFFLKRLQGRIGYQYEPHEKLYNLGFSVPSPVTECPILKPAPQNTWKFHSWTMKWPPLGWLSSIYINIYGSPKYDWKTTVKRKPYCWWKKSCKHPRCWSCLSSSPSLAACSKAHVANATQVSFLGHIGRCDQAATWHSLAPFVGDSPHSAREVLQQGHIWGSTRKYWDASSWLKLFRNYWDLPRAKSLIILSLLWTPFVPEDIIVELLEAKSIRQKHLESSQYGKFCAYQLVQRGRIPQSKAPVKEFWTAGDGIWGNMGWQSAKVERTF